MTSVNFKALTELFKFIKSITPSSKFPYILKTALYEFPIENIEINMPDWVAVLDKNHPLKNKYFKLVILYTR